MRQEDAYGCGVAAMAMLTGRTYAEVKASFTNDFSGGGHSVFMWDQYLAEHGYGTARKYRYLYGRERAVWPCEPFADVHLCLVHVVEGPGHMVVLLRDGTVLDPLTPEPRRLSDYAGVSDIAAVVPIGRQP